MIKTSFYTLGCKLNQCESEALASSFKSRGFFITPPSEKADIYVVNTCTVTTKAEQKTRRMIRKFSRENSGSVVFVTGCYAQLNKEQLSSLGDNVFVVPMDLKHTIMDAPGVMEEDLSLGMTLRESAEHFISSSERTADLPMKGVSQERFKFTGSTHTSHARGYLKIQDGCDNSCTYCRVRIARGRSVSLAHSEVVKRALDLERDGYREIILTGVNISDYRSPEDENIRLPGLINALVFALSAARIRLSSVEPDMIDEDFIQAVRHPSVVPHFHIPVQSGSDMVLERVKRKYKASKVVEVVSLLRSVKKDPFIAADLIVGLPYEGEKDFMDSYNLVKSCGFSQVHIFPYSPRPGTELFDVKVHVPERITKERVGRMHDLASSLYSEYLGRCKGRIVEVILEKESLLKGENVWLGVSDNYLHLGVAGVSEGEGNRGRVVLAKIKGVENGITGEFIKFD